MKRSAEDLRAGDPLQQGYAVFAAGGEAYSAHMDSVEGERRRKAEHERLRAAAGAYVDDLLSHASDPALSAKLIGDRPFLIACMAGFACEEVTRTLGEMK